jgi:hypothetical protein
LSAICGESSRVFKFRVLPDDEQFTVLRQWVNSQLSQVILRASGKADPVKSAVEFGAKF